MLHLCFFSLFIVSQEVNQKYIDLARSAADDLKKGLLQVLTEEISKGGYQNAISVCSDMAQEITKKYQEKYSLYVRRVSEKPRNKLNSPDTYELEILKKLDKMSKDGKLPKEYFEVVKEGGRTYLRYFSPIVIQPMCLPCHGDQKFLSDEIKSFLKRRYPEDKAIGYKEGDFRGAVSVKIELKER
ncbi:hypothetical protein HRbin19_00819 [bacterium HR19]|nr:hypothetical protein HRbin19_00819 [bacterium HR19]